MSLKDNLMSEEKVGIYKCYSYLDIEQAFEDWKEFNNLMQELEYCHSNRRDEIIKYLEAKHNCEWTEIDFKYIFGWDDE